MIIRDNFCYFCTKTYVMIPHLNRLDKTVQMKGHNICFYAEMTKIIPVIIEYMYSSYLELLLTRTNVKQLGY